MTRYTSKDRKPFKVGQLTIRTNVPENGIHIVLSFEWLPACNDWYVRFIIQRTGKKDAILSQFLHAAEKRDD